MDQLPTVSAESAIEKVLIVEDKLQDANLLSARRDESQEQSKSVNESTTEKKKVSDIHTSEIITDESKFEETRDRYRKNYDRFVQITEEIYNSKVLDKLVLIKRQKEMGASLSDEGASGSGLNLGGPTEEVDSAALSDDN